LSAPPGCDISTFRVFTDDDVTAVIRKLPYKQCATDTLPTRHLILKDNADMLVPFITELFNRSLTSGLFPTRFKAAFVTRY